MKKIDSLYVGLWLILVVCAVLYGPTFGSDHAARSYESRRSTARIDSAGEVLTRRAESAVSAARKAEGRVAMAVRAGTADRNLSFMNLLPECKTYNERLRNDFYESCYSRGYRMPVWVGWVIRSSRKKDVADRSNCSWKTDYRTAPYPVTDSEYRRSGYDRGHMAPAEDFDFDQGAQQQTFLLSNACPQYGQLNRGEWSRAEARCRELALKHDSVLVMSGPCGSIGSIRTGTSSLEVPRYFWKVVAWSEGGSLRTESWVFENTEDPGSLESSVVSIDSVESLSGLDLFYVLPDAYENRIER